MSAQILCLMTCVLAVAAETARAELPKDYLLRWDDPAVQKRIDDGIEKNRKSDMELRIVDPKGEPLAGAGVQVTQESHAFLFGCNSFVVGQMKDKNEAYEQAFVRLFNFATVAFYWDDLEPEPGKLRFQEGSPYIWRRPPPDRVVAFGKEHGLTLKGHPLMWPNMTHNPDWMPRDPEALRKRYIERFREIAARYADDIPIWDGVNESLVAPPEFPLYSAEDRNDPSFVPWAFAVQQKIFQPKNVLHINDVTTFNWPADKSNRYYRQCRQLLENDVPIEGIGFQFHFFSRKSLDGYISGERCDPNVLLDTYELFAHLGLPLWITEITIGSAGEDGPAIQERVVRDMYRLWFSAPKMSGITWWNLADGAAYGNEGIAGGGLVDEAMNPKPAYEALDRLINHDWKTKLATRSTADGKVNFRGFHGDYEIEVTQPGSRKTFQVTVASDGPGKATLTMPRAGPLTPVP